MSVWSSLALILAGGGLTGLSTIWGERGRDVRAAKRAAAERAAQRLEAAHDASVRDELAGLEATREAVAVMIRAASTVWEVEVGIGARFDLARRRGELVAARAELLVSASRLFDGVIRADLARAAEAADFYLEGSPESRETPAGALLRSTQSDCESALEAIAKRVERLRQRDSSDQVVTNRGLRWLWGPK